MNYLTMCGMLAGSMTDPPALAFANNLHPTSGAAALSYATVYPLVMFLRIITPQLLAVAFWSNRLPFSGWGPRKCEFPLHSLAFLNNTH